MSKDLNKIIFISILGLAFYLRLYGITNGFPYIFHPDEPTIVRSALGIRFFPNPGHFDWPHLYIYVNYFAYMAFATLRDFATQYGFKDTLSSMFPILWDDNLIYYLITRVMTATLGALTVIPVYLTGKKLFGVKAGVLAALAFALIPFHVRHSHYSLPDAPMVFLLSWAMYFASNILIKGDPANYAGAGTYVGFAASTKYHGGLGAITVPIAHIFRVLKNKESFLNITNVLNLVLSGILAVIAFILGTPYAALDYKTFLRTDGPKGAMWQFSNVGSVPWMERPTRFFNEMVYRVSDDLAYVFMIVMAIVFLILAIKLIKKRTLTNDYHAWFILVCALILLFYISGFERPRSHYYMIAYPFIAVLFGYFGAFVFEKLEPRLKFGVFIIFAILFVYPLYLSAKNAYTFANPDSRNILATWLTENSGTTTPLIYNSSELSLVMDDFKGRSSKGAEKLETTYDGYYINSSDTAEQSFGVLKFGSRLNRVFIIDSTYNNGPRITIYKIQP